MGGFGYDDKDDIKVKGDDGTEEGQLIASYDDKLFVVDVINGSAVYGSLAVGLTAVELKVGASVLPLRTLITMQPQGNKIYWGYDNTVTTSTGTRIFKDQFIAIPLAVGVSVWFISDTAGQSVRIAELA